MWQPNKLERERLEKAERLEAQGVALYPARVERTHSIGEAVDAFGRFELDQQADTEERSAPPRVVVTGRIRRLNAKGKVSFLHIEDESGRVQLFARINDSGRGQV